MQNLDDYIIEINIDGKWFTLTRLYAVSDAIIYAENLYITSRVVSSKTSKVIAEFQH